MKDFVETLGRAQAGDLAAFGEIVRRFQDMAVGYAYSVLGDFDLAEDAAQEAFVRAYQDLPALRDLQAFPPWFRKIVLYQCTRWTRRKGLATVPLESAGEIAAKEPDPAQAAERREIRDRVLEAIRALPEHERAAVTLYYINGYSQAEVGEFLDVPVSTVKNRLYSARGRLRERMTDMVEKELKESRPGKAFTKRVIHEIGQVRVYVGKGKTEPFALLMLTDSRKRSFPIYIGNPEARAVAPWLEGKGDPNATDLHTALVRSLDRFGERIKKVHVNALLRETFHALVSVTNGSRVREVDCRPSDALNFAVRADAPITAAEEVMARTELTERDGKPLSPAKAWKSVTSPPGIAAGHPLRIAPVSRVLSQLEEDPESEEARRLLPQSLLRQVRPGVFTSDAAKLDRFRDWAERKKSGAIRGAALGLLGAVYMRPFWGDVVRALPALETARRLRPKDADLAFDLATAYALSGRKHDVLPILLAIKHPATAVCNNFKELWSDPRFAAAFGEPEASAEEKFYVAQLNVRSMSGGPSKPRGKPVLPQKPVLPRAGPFEPASASPATAERLADCLGAGPLLAVEMVFHSVPSGRGRRVMLGTEGNRAGVLPVSQLQCPDLDVALSLVRPIRPLTPHAVASILKAAGLGMEGAVLVKRTRAGIEGALVLRKGRRLEPISIDGFAAIRLAAAAECPLFITESFAEKIFYRGKTGRPLAPKTVRERLAKGAEKP